MTRPVVPDRRTYHDRRAHELPAEQMAVLVKIADIQNQLATCKPDEYDALMLKLREATAETVKFAKISRLS